MSFSTAARVLAPIFFTPISLLLITVVAVLDFAIATSATPSEIQDLVLVRYLFVAGFCVIGVIWGMSARWAALKRIYGNKDVPFYRRCTSAFMAGILVGGLVIATTSTSVAFLTGFLLSVQNLPTASVENAGWIVVSTLVIPILAAYIAARKYIGEPTYERENGHIEDTGKLIDSRRNKIHVIAAAIILVFAILVSQLRGDGQAKFSHR